MESSLVSTPIGGGTSTIKKFYSLKTSQNASPIEDTWIEKSSVNKLDSLLNDLKNERDITREQDLYDSSNSNYFVEEYGSPTKTTKYFYSKQENVDTSYPEVIKQHNYYSSNSGTLNIDKSSKFEQQFDDMTIEKPFNHSPITYSNSSTMRSSKNTSTGNNEYNNLQINELKDLQLSENILPVPGTKVTTTVRTYTYEVPAGANLKRDVMITDVRSENNQYMGENIVNDNFNKKESYSNYEVNSSHRSVPTNKKTVKYVTQSEVYDRENQIQPVEIITTNSDKYTSKHTVLPPVSMPVDTSTNSYYYKNETSHYNNTPRENVPKSIEYRVESTTNVNNMSGHPMPVPNDTTVTYRFSETTSNTTNEVVQPFPVYDDTDRASNGQPPKHLNELLTNLNGVGPNGHNYNDSYNPKHEVETAVAAENGNNKIVVSSKNYAGPPVYYPPNHEMTLRKEEKSAAYRAGGGWARGRGEYEYEAESKSKSKSKSGGAVVPVCLPLCCAMPCSIM